MTVLSKICWLMPIFLVSGVPACAEFEQPDMVTYQKSIRHVFLQTTSDEMVKVCHAFDKLALKHFDISSGEFSALEQDAIFWDQALNERNIKPADQEYLSQLSSEIAFELDETNEEQAARYKNGMRVQNACISKFIEASALADNEISANNVFHETAAIDAGFLVSGDQSGVIK